MSSRQKAFYTRGSENAKRYAPRSTFLRLLRSHLFEKSATVVSRFGWRHLDKAFIVTCRRLELETNKTFLRCLRVVDP